MSTSYDLLVGFYSAVLHIFFREIKTRNEHYVPKSGPLIFVAAPHSNQFVDPLMIMSQLNRKVGFLAADKTMKRKYVGALARIMDSIPVVRAQDIAVRGSGSIRLVDRYQKPTVITGVGTKFTQELKVGWSIALPRDKGSSQVVEINSDTEILVAREFRDLAALEMLTAPEGTPYKCVPHIDQGELYRTVHERLVQGGCIGIFPEGGSHDRAEMLPLKAGVTIMALGAMAEHPELNVRIVPCGLNYFHPDKFRSRAVLEFGKPISINRDWVEMFTRGGPERREACGKLLDIIYNRLREVTINTPDYETLMVIQAARRLYKWPQNRRYRKLDASRSLRLTRRLVEGYIHYADKDPRVGELRDRVLEYNNLLMTYRLRDHQVGKTMLGPHRAAALLVYRVMWLVFMAAAALPGLVLNAPLFVIARYYSSQKAKEALAASTVKIRARDVLATWKLLVALVLVPSIYLLYSFIGFYWCYYKLNWGFVPSFAFFFKVFAFMPVVSYISLVFGERGIDIYKSLRPLSIQLVPGANKKVKNLCEMREELATSITSLINELGPELYPDWNTRMFRSLSELDDSGTSGASTPRQINLRGWIKSPIELLDSQTFSWEHTDEKDEDGVFFFGHESEDERKVISGRSRRNSDHSEEHPLKR